MNTNDPASFSTRPNPPSRARRERTLKHESTYDEFILWFALPRHEKMRMRLETQEDFAKYHGLDKHTLSDWRKRRDFEPRLKELRNRWGMERTQDVIDAMFRSAIGDSASAPQAQRLWLQYVEGWREGHKPEKPQEILHPDDIRSLINAFPESMQARYFGYLREILDAASDLEGKGLLVSDVTPLEESLSDL